jgi:hypothetical protein
VSQKKNKYKGNKMSKRRVLKVHLEGGEKHEHITKMIWADPESIEDRHESTKAQMVEFVTKNPEGAYVYDAPTKTRVLLGVVKANPPYVRTYRDGEWQDNLLALPRY